jgi:hypothetical protein
MRKRKLLYSFLIACAFTLIPLSILFLPYDNPIVNGLKIPFGCLMLPGFLVGVIADGGILHGINPFILAIGNLLFYFGFVYVLLGFWERRTGIAI